jgi:ABC-type branched-subunit amino acid transport system substrate-binding protein
LRSLVTAVALVLALAGHARAQDTIKIGLIMPLTGNAASAGQQSKAAVELGPQKSAAAKLIYPFKGWQ